MNRHSIGESKAYTTALLNCCPKFTLSFMNKNSSFCFGKKQKTLQRTSLRCVCKFRYLCAIHINHLLYKYPVAGYSQSIALFLSPPADWIANEYLCFRLACISVAFRLNCSKFWARIVYCSLPLLFFVFRWRKRIGIESSSDSGRLDLCFWHDLHAICDLLGKERKHPFKKEKQEKFSKLLGLRHQLLELFR